MVFTAARNSKRSRGPMFDWEPGQTEPRGPGQQWLDRVVLLPLPGAARGRGGLCLTWGSWNSGGQVNDGWTVWPKRAV